MISRRLLPSVGVLLLVASGLASARAASTADGEDPVLRAMHEEMDRSTAKLKLDGVLAPYFIEYRISDVDDFEAAQSSARCERSNERTYDLRA